MNTAIPVCVVEQIEQFEALAKAFGHDYSDRVRLYCVCSETSALLRERGVSFVEVSDSIIQDRWAQINVWAKQVSLSWFENPRVRDFLEIDGINMGNVLSRPIAHLLIRQAKHMLFAEKILAENPQRPVLLFENFFRSFFLLRRRESNTFNQLLGTMAQQRGFSVRRLHAWVVPDKRFSLTFLLKTVAGRLIGLRGEAGDCDVVASGALKHLLPVLEGLRGKHKIALFGVQGFQKRDREICRQYDFGYVLPESVLDSDDRRRLAELRREMAKRWDRLKNAMKEGELFAFSGLTPPLMEEVILAKMCALFPIKCKLALASRAIARRLKPCLALLDEDVDWRRVLAMVFQQEGVRPFVLSHGIPNSTGNTDGLFCRAGIADTIVNSDFEKDKYILSGWDAAQLHVCGLPRYDMIHRLAQAGREQNRLRPRGDKKIVLYCPHMLTRRRKRKEGFLGIHTPGNETRHNTLVLIEACKKAGCKLIIKPHSDAGDIPLWEALVREYGNADVRLLPHTADIFHHMAQADVIVATFSTAILEAVLFGKSAIAINFTGKPDVHPFAEKRIAAGVRREDDLAVVLGSDIPVPSAETIRYFCGKNDGHATERVVAFLENQMQSHSLGIESVAGGGVIPEQRLSGAAREPMSIFATVETLAPASFMPGNSEGPPSKNRTWAHCGDRSSERITPPPQTELQKETK